MTKRIVTAQKRVADSRGTLRTSTQVNIAAVNNGQETITLQGRGGRTQIAHAFNSENAWVRSMPSAGTTVTLQYNESKNAYDFVAYVPTGVPEKIKRYAEGKGLYRVLAPGEHEIKSSGGVSTYWGSRSYYATRAGAVKHILDGESLEATTRAPTHIIEGHRKRNDRLGHEQRFGVVKRPLTAGTQMTVTTAMSNPAAGKFTYAYEWMVKLNNDLDAPLYDHRIGDVYDDVPKPGVPFSAPIQGENGVPLRARTRYYATQEPLGIGLPDYTETTIDANGNMTVDLAKVAVVGFVMRVPSGSYSLTAGQEVQIQGKLGISMVSQGGAVEINGQTGVHVTTKDVVTVKASRDISMETPMEVSISGSGGVKVSSDAKIVVDGKAGVQLLGAMGSTGRKIATLQSDPSTGIPLWLDPTLEN